MNYDEALAYLLRLGHETLAIKFGLENTEHLLASLGQPQLQFPKVQLAGTNGKGSTAVMLDAICRAANIKTGLYTSPHLVNITERIRIDGHEISEEDFARYATQVSVAADQLVRAGTLPALPTFFEHLTAIALAAFKERNIELGILETGLGGRLDSTTAAAAEVVVVTPIAMDHQEYLGDTIEEIAGEKAAIIRPGTVAVVAPQPRDVLNVILKHCASVDVSPILVKPEMQIHDIDRLGRLNVSFKTKERVYQNVRLSLPGRHQADNACVAIATAEALITRGFKIEKRAIIEGLTTANHPGRIEWQMGKPTLLFDGAHNAAGALALRDFLDEFVDVPLTLVFGAMRDKDLTSMATALFPGANRIILTEIDNPRSASAEQLTHLARLELTGDRPGVFSNSADALRAAREQTSPDEVICVTGSLYLIGEVKRGEGRRPGRR